MPELPEVETYRKYFSRYALNKKVLSVTHIDRYLLKDGLDPVQLASHLKGRRFISALRHGKYLLLETSGHKYLILHFGMTGYLKYTHHIDAALHHTASGVPCHTRLLLSFDGSSLAMVNTRRLGRIYLYGDICFFLREKKLGPDALHIGKDEFLGRLSERNRPIKSALLDQSIIAGIGNLYADEILFQTSVHPLSICKDISRNIYYRMFENMILILTTAVRKNADMKKYPKDWLLSHRDRQKTCPHCGGKPEVIRIGGRTTFFCPRSQKRSI